MAQQQRRVKMAYKVVGPKKVMQEYTHASIDEETKSLKQEKKIRELDMYMVYLPAGHSIRIDKAELVRLGFDKRPRMIDMETGDVVDLGGGDWDIPVPDDVSIEDDEEEEVSRSAASSRRKG